MKQFAIAIAWLAVVPAFAQAPAVLIEACNAVPDAQTRLECLKAAMGANTVAPKTQAIEAVARAFAGMQASVEVGISYNNYQLAILDLAKAVATYQQDAGDAGRESAIPLKAALEAYGDAGTFWERSVSFYARRGNDLAYSGGMPVSLNGLDWLVAKYGLGTVKADFWGIERGLPVQSTRSYLWSIAKQKADEGMRLARLPPGKPEAPVDPEMQAVHSLVRSQRCRDYPAVEKTGSSESGTIYLAACSDGSKLTVACTAGMCRVQY